MLRPRQSVAGISWVLLYSSACQQPSTLESPLIAAPAIEAIHRPQKATPCEHPRQFRELTEECIRVFKEQNRFCDKHVAKEVAKFASKCVTSFLGAGPPAGRSQAYLQCFNEGLDSIDNLDPGPCLDFVESNLGHCEANAEIVACNCPDGPRCPSTGECMAACTGGKQFDDATCTCRCPGSTVSCPSSSGEQCVSIFQDPNCGRCGNNCANARQVCRGGLCGCSDDQVQCQSGECVNANSCSPGKQLNLSSCLCECASPCADGGPQDSLTCQCGCPEGQSRCDGACVPKLDTWLFSGLDGCGVVHRVYIIVPPGTSVDMGSNHDYPAWQDMYDCDRDGVGETPSPGSPDVYLVQPFVGGQCVAFCSYGSGAYFPSLGRASFSQCHPPDDGTVVRR
jgi:hypothetical protein